MENRPLCTWRSHFWLLSGLINFGNKYASSSGSGDALGKGGSRVVLCVLPSLGWEVRVRAGSACLRPPSPAKQKSTCWTVRGSRPSQRPGKAGKSPICDLRCPLSSQPGAYSSCPRRWIVDIGYDVLVGTKKIWRSALQSQLGQRV